jgi:phosphonate transport system permease protein
MASVQPPIARAAAGQAEVPRVPERPKPGRGRLYTYLACLLILALLVFAWIEVQASIGQLVRGFFGPKGFVRDVVPHSVPPDMGQLWPGVKAAMVTLSIAVLSIVFGVIGALAMLPFAARNITPSPALYALARGIQAVLRAIPELIMLLIFIICVGIGPWSATVALTFHGIGVKGKLFAEAVEEMDTSAVDALRVAGAGRIQVFLHAVLPGVRNTLTALTLYRLDANFRSAVTLGAVGGGGIGFLIDNELSIFAFKTVMTYIIVLVIVVLAVERVSSELRSRLA